MDCQHAKEFFRQHNVVYTDHNMATDQGARQRLEKLIGRVATPTIVVDGEIIIGFEDNKDRLTQLLGIH